MKIKKFKQKAVAMLRVAEETYYTVSKETRYEQQAEKTQQYAIYTANLEPVRDSNPEVALKNLRELVRAHVKKQFEE